MLAFLHDATGARVLFGAGRRHEAADELSRLGPRPMLVVDEIAADVASDVRGDLAAAAVAVIDRVRQHVPIEDAEAAAELARGRDADCICALGGGSTIGLAKAVALRTGLPILAVPTTYAGSEMTPVWGQTDAGVKRTGRDPVVAPRTVVYDPELTYSLPPDITAASGLNAVAHCVDALWAPGRSPLTDLVAERGIAFLAKSLPGAVADGRDAEARATALAGAWLAGVAFGIAGSSLHHKLCHALGGRFNLPHAETHAVMLPLTTELALRHERDAARTITRALDADDAVSGLQELGRQLGAPTGLARFGLTAEGAAALAEDVDVTALATPFRVTEDDVRDVLLAAAT